MKNIIVVEGLCPATGQRCKVSVPCVNQGTISSSVWVKQAPYCPLRSGQEDCFSCSLVRAALATDCDKYFSTAREEGR